MKTAEHYIKDPKYKGELFLGGYNNPSIAFNLIDLEILIKSYGRQCAEQALKDAADRAEMIDDGTSNYDAKSICKESITSTPILTP